MADEKTYTEKEVVLRERKAFYSGYVALNWCSCEASEVCGTCQAETNRRYPLPKVTRPRVVIDAGGAGVREWRYVEGQIQTRVRGTTHWFCLAHGDAFAAKAVQHEDVGFAWTPERINMLAKLIADPTEIVDDDAS